MYKRVEKKVSHCQTILCVHQQHGHGDLKNNVRLPTVTELPSNHFVSDTVQSLVVPRVSSSS